jgi:putative intracellular protease/amidase
MAAWSNTLLNPIQKLIAMKRAHFFRLLCATATMSASLIAAEPTPKAKVLFVLTSHDSKGSTGKPTGFYLGEATHPYHELVKAGYAVDFVSPQGGKAPVDGFDLDDPINKQYWNDRAFRQGIENTLKPSDIRPADYAAIFYVGGHGAMWDLAQDKLLPKIATAIYEKGGMVGAVCHGPAGLVPILLSNGEPLVKGRDVAAFTNEEEAAVALDKVVPFLLADALIEKGAKHHPAPNWEPRVVVSGRLVTGQNPASASGVGKAMVKLLDEPGVRNRTK